MKYALELDGRLVQIPFATRGQVGDALDRAIDTIPQMPRHELYVLVPLDDWDNMRNWIDDISIMVSE